MRRENVDGLDGNGLLKTYVFSMEDKMAAEPLGHAKNYGHEKCRVSVFS